MLDCDACCRSYHQDCVVPKQAEREKAFYCEACIERGWHIQPPAFEDENLGSSRLQPTVEPVQKSTTKGEDAKPKLETPKSVTSTKENTVLNRKDDSSSQSAARELSEDDTSVDGQGDVIRSLQSLRERVTILEKENEAIQPNSQPKNPKKREHNA